MGDKRTFFVRCVIWFGIIADFVNVVQYCFPASTMRALGISTPLTPPLRFILMHAAVLMAAWTLLLLWADRRPVERRGVLLLTVLIALGMGASMCYLAIVGALQGASIFVFGGPAFTAALFLAAFMTARKVKA